MSSPSSLFKDGNEVTVRIFKSKGQAAKWSPRTPRIALDFCNNCIAIYNGCSCGPCFCIPFQAAEPPTCEDILSLFPENDTAIEGVTLPSGLCEALTQIPISDTTINGVTLPSELCDALQQFPVSDASVAAGS